MVAKIHHALVDGRSAVEVAQLLFDVEPNGVAELPVPWEAPQAPGSTRLAARAVALGAGESLRAARGVARMAGEPRVAASRIAGTLRRAALAAGEDLLRPAPASVLNARIGPRRTLVRHSVDLEAVRQVKAVAGATVNDVCLALAAGALRDLALTRGDEPSPLKAMVPVNVRTEDEAQSLGNRGVAARAVASPRLFNLTISNVPGPRFPRTRTPSRRCASCPRPSTLHSESYSSLRGCRGGGAGREVGPFPPLPQRPWPASPGHLSDETASPASS